MKHPIEKALLPCVLSAALLSGCTIALSPTTAGSASESTVPPGQEVKGPLSSSEAVVSGSITSPQVAQPTASPAPQPTQTPASAADTTRKGLSEAAEWELFSQFWNEACIGNIVVTPCGEDFSQYRNEYWRLSSLYLQNQTATAGEEPLRDANGVIYYPMDDYVQTLQAMFGEGDDYSAYLPDEPGPTDGTLLVCSGYGFGYVAAVLNQDSFSLQGEIITVDAALLWREPGFTKEQGTLQYEFLVQPENPYSRYRFVSLSGDKISF